jgi:hypothetical protein
VTTSKRACKDCGSTTRATPHPGPRCATCYRASRKAARERAHDRYVSRVYRLPPSAYGLLYRHQGGRCAICQVATGRVRNLAVDHDHRHCGTGCPQCVRGLLCGPCNIMIGRLGVDALRRAARYLEDPPATKILLEGDL